MLAFLKHTAVLGCLVFFSYAVRCQIIKTIVPKEKFLVFEERLNSVKQFADKGEINIYKVCSIESHSKYNIKNTNITFSKFGLTLDGPLRKSYINMYALIDIANDFYLNKNYDSASWYWFRALDTALRYKFDGEELHGLRMALNNDCFLLGDYTGAMKVSVAGLVKAEQIGDENRMAHFNNVIGYIYMKLGDTSKAAIYYNNHLKNARNTNDSFEVAHAFYNLGDLSITKKNYDKAIEYFSLALDTYNAIQDSSFFSSYERRGYISNKLAQCHKLKGNLNYALELIRISLDVAAHAKGVNEYDKADFFINGGDIYNWLQQPDSALMLLRKGLEIATRINHREFKRDAFEQIAYSYSQKRIYDSAFLFQSRYSKLKDSILNEISREEIYQRDADLQIERQQQLQKIAIQRQKSWRNIIIIIASLLVITAFLLYNHYRLKQKNQYQKELNRQQVELFNAIAAAQEQERKRIAQDIHDGLGSVLSAAKLKLAEAKESTPDIGSDEKFLSGITLLDEASAELRTISHNIMPATLSKLGLIPALKNLSEKISSDKGLQVIFTAYEFNSRLDEQMEISIYRIILELINNIVKHAAATRATIQLVKHPDSINISVEDNGKGFDYQKALQDKKGIGLGNVLSRVDYMKGTIDIDAVPDRGTMILIDIPWKKGGNGNTKIMV